MNRLLIGRDRVGAAAGLGIYETVVALHAELGGPEPLVLAVGQKSADTMGGRFGLFAVGLRHPANGGGANLYREGFAEAVERILR
nr:hypothetical protein [Veillonella denticariosi]